MFAMAGVYGRFDTYRVSDMTAHQAAKALAMATFSTLDADKVTAFKARIGQVLGDNMVRANICKDINRIGPPDYYPSYMLQHGMAAFTEKNKLSKALVTPFDIPGAWKKALEGYLQCP